MTLQALHVANELMDQRIDPRVDVYEGPITSSKQSRYQRRAQPGQKRTMLLREAM